MLKILMEEGNWLRFLLSSRRDSLMNGITVGKKVFKLLPIAKVPVITVVLWDTQKRSVLNAHADWELGLHKKE
jgi:hypothetical protein